ncbi:LysR family transcriptional regulator [Taibaiella chishuiensis]|uniref:DNA-binding transcriptional LysR family regulator n=1 Tax=Taibaiella chishuiensis TaxID=1434707 RepID=A0A2P8CX81_9BACT|nr:LysR family transcriptional regulator [Taibaiella chishuiensis]PSK89588.1 DNA-binding transcriptional LysR family regulator [Taibaiella chishuiensis]
MFDFRLQVFYTVAKRLNFTRAAEELCITQPAVTKHIHELEAYFKVKLLDRKGNKTLLTAAGETLLQQTEALQLLYRNMEFEMSAHVRKHKGQLRIGASTTVAQYVLPQVLAAFRKKFPDITVSLTTGNTEQTERALEHREIDLGVIEGHSRKAQVRYTEFIRDELVLVSRVQNPLAAKASISAEELKQIPLLLREPGSGTLEVLAHALKPLHIKTGDLKKEMQLSSTESIKRYLLHSDSMAFVSIYAVLKELELRECCVIDVTGLDINRHFYFIEPQGQTPALPALFKRFALRYNFR